jgi:hypothetical protein
VSDLPGRNHYTREEANAALATLAPLLERLREARDELTDAEAHAALADSAGGNGGGDPGTHVGEAFLEVRRILLALEEAGIVVRDIDRGLVDFPSTRDGRPIYLCWQLDEPEIGWWHGPDAGFGGREPLD